jgi:peptide/nickel transport system permease protein
MNDNVNTNEQVLITKKYKKRSQMGDIFHSLMRNKGAMAGLIILGLLLIAFVCSLLISWESITVINPWIRFTRPNRQYLFGTDDFGRDLFLRVIYGTRYTLAIGLGSVTFATLFGVTAGCIAGFYGGKIEDVIMRASDVIASIPGMLLGMVVVTVLGQSLQNLIIAVGVQAIPIYLRMARASVLTVRNQEFVEAAKAIGLSNFRIIFTQVLPNGLAPIFVTVTASLGISIIVASSLSYLGFGVPPPHPEWGAIIAGAKEFARHAPYMMFFPGVFIMITVLAFNLLGDGLRDALDPKLKK